MNDEQYRSETDADTGTGDGSGGEELFADLGQFETGAIPVDATLKQGRTIRRRRRVVGGGALAIAAALSIGVPVAVAGGGGSGYGAASGPDGMYAASSSGAKVTVNPTPLSHGKAHFSGTIDGKAWSVAYDNKDCDGLTWSCGFDGPYPWDQYASLAPDSGWGLGGQSDNYVLFLKKDTSRVTITLQDGEVLRLEAVPVANGPVVLFALPFGLGVGKVQLYDAQGAEIAYTVPFNIKGSPSVAGHWYKPSENPPTKTGSVDLARGDGGIGGPQVVTAYVGPSGPCVVVQAGGHPHPSCTENATLTGSPTFATSNEGLTAYGLVAPTIDHIRLEYTDGSTAPVPIKSLGGYRFYAYIAPKGKTLSAVTAFDASGKPLPTQNNMK